MRRRRARGATIIGLVCLACGPADADTEGDAVAEAGGGDPAAAAIEYPRVEELAENVYAYEQRHAVGDETITTISMFVVTPAGVLVADGQESVEETQRLIDAIGEVTDQPIRHVVIASDHGDHSAGNSAFPDDAAFYAHPTSAATLEAQAASPNRPEDAPPIILPTRLVEEELALDVGGREIRILHLGRAHTGGDLVVHVPEGNVLFMSETFMDRIFPAMRSAYPSEWVAMLDAAQALGADVYVPGHGIVGSPSIASGDLETYRRAIWTVVDVTTGLHHAGASLDEAIERADFGKIDGWALAAGQRPRAIGRVYMELDGELSR